MPNFRINRSVGGGQHEYSTSEQVVGKWIDGKSVYEKTIVLREDDVDKYTKDGYLYNVGLTGTDKIWLTGLYAKRGSAGNTMYTDIISAADDVVIVFKHTDGSIYFKDNFVPTDVIVIFRYTKVND